MSLDPKTGHFILTISTARLAFHIVADDTEAIAARLRARGIEVHEVCPAWVRCDMRPGAIWQAFHAERPDPSFVSALWTPTAQKLYPQWAAEELSETEVKAVRDTSCLA